MVVYPKMWCPQTWTHPKFKLNWRPWTDHQPGSAQPSPQLCGAEWGDPVDMLCLRLMVVVISGISMWPLVPLLWWHVKLGWVSQSKLSPRLYFLPERLGLETWSLDAPQSSLVQKTGLNANWSQPQQTVIMTRLMCTCSRAEENSIRPGPVCTPIPQKQSTLCPLVMLWLHLLISDSIESEKGKMWFL